MRRKHLQKPIKFNDSSVSLAISNGTVTNDIADVLILGSCIHMRSWISSSKRFVKRSAASLQSNPKPTWAFSIGMPPDDQVEAEARIMETWLRKQIPLRGHTLFQGRWNHDDFGGCLKLLTSCFKVKNEDKRKWNSMDEWADAVVGELRNDQRSGLLSI